MMVRIKELQRRLDQTLGKPGSYLTGMDRIGNLKPMTVGARLYRVEQQLSGMDKKMDQLMYTLNAITHLKQQQQQQTHPVVNTASSCTGHYAVPSLQHQPLAAGALLTTPIQPPLKYIEDDV